MSSDRFGITIRKKDFNAKFVWFDHFTKASEAKTKIQFDYRIFCQGECDLVVKTRCEGINQDTPKLLKNFERKFSTGQYDFKTDEIALSKESCPGGLYQSMGYCLREPNNVLHIMSIRPKIMRTQLATIKKRKK